MKNDAMKYEYKAYKFAVENTKYNFDVKAVIEEDPFGEKEDGIRNKNSPESRNLFLFNWTQTVV